MVKAPHCISLLSIMRIIPADRLVGRTPSPPAENVDVPNTTPAMAGRCQSRESISSRACIQGGRWHFHIPPRVCLSVCRAGLSFHLLAGDASFSESPVPCAVVAHITLSPAPRRLVVDVWPCLQDCWVWGNDEGEG